MHCPDQAGSAERLEISKNLPVPELSSQSSWLASPAKEFFFSQHSVGMRLANAANNASESWELNPWWPGATNPVGAESA